MYDDVIASGSGTVGNESDQEIVYVPEVILALGGESTHMVPDVYDQISSKSSEKMNSNSFSGDQTQDDTIYDIDQQAYVAKVGSSLNISCISPGDNFWCSSTTSFNKSIVWLDHSSCFTRMKDTSSASVRVVYHSRVEELSNRMKLDDDLLQRKDWVASTLVLKNISVNDVGSYECFTFYPQHEDTENDQETIYQTLYLYVDGEFDRLSVPIDHLFPKITLESEDVFVINAMIGTNLILPCRPIHPEISVHLFKQEYKTDKKLVDVINDINSKFSSSKFYQHDVTPLFYFHPRIGFVLDEISENDNGIYHCQFTSAYKLEEFLSINVTVKNHEEMTFVNLHKINSNSSSDENEEITSAGFKLKPKILIFRLISFQLFIIMLFKK